MAEKIGEDMITQGIKIKRPAIPTKVCGNNYLFILSLCFILFVFFSILARELGDSLSVIVGLTTHSYYLITNFLKTWKLFLVLIDHPDFISHILH